MVVRKKHLIITVDTEGHKGSSPIDNLVYGKIGRENYGIDLIMEICNRYGIKATFFVDIAESWDFGEDTIKEVIQTITNQGHDVQIHLHPDHMADNSRPFLWEYSRTEQKDIISKCVAKYIEFTGKFPIAFRAGKYGANYDTLDILSEEGVKLDFSQFYNQKWCGLNPPLTINSPKLYKRVFEVPVTVYKSFDFLKIKRFDKIDINSISIGEFKKVFNSIKHDNNIEIVTFFMHSFSFLKRYDGDNVVKPNWKEIRKFEAILEFIKNESDIEVVTSQNILDLLLNKRVIIGEDSIPTVSLFYMVYFTALRSLKLVKTNKKARVFLISLLFSTTTIFILIICLIKRYF